MVYNQALKVNIELEHLRIDEVLYHIGLGTFFPIRLLTLNIFKYFDLHKLTIQINKLTN